jgi:dihydrofolate synthase/folylpolyglutamate synthase
MQNIIFCKPIFPRGLDASIYNKKKSCCTSRRSIHCISEAYQIALKNAETDFIYAGGSTFVVAEIL